jgi:MFS transporter, DHA2 family, multidrug resistance protein
MATQQIQAPAAPFSPVEHGWRLVAVATACLISVFLDQSTSGMVGGVSAYMTGTLGASSDQGLWLLIGYNTCYYLSLIASPFTITRFGRRKVWVIGHIAFAVASIMIAVSGGFWSVVGWRMLQGLGQGTFFVCAVMTVLRVFPPAATFIGFAIFATTSLVGASLGPAIGGWFSDQNAWPQVFLLLAALALVAASLVARVLRDPPDQGLRDGSFDFTGLLLALVHYFTFHFITQEGERRDWLGNPQIRAYFVIFCAATAAFIIWELRRGIRPFIKLRLFAIRNLRYGTFLGFALGVPLFGANIFDQYLQNGIGFTAWLAGAEIALRSVTIALVVPIVAYTLAKQLVDPRYYIIAGFLLVSLSYWMLFFGATSLSDFHTFVVPSLIQGCGFSLLFSPIARAVILSLPAEDFPQGVAIFKLTLVAGGALASTALGVIFDHRNTLHLARIAGDVSRASPFIVTVQHLDKASLVGIASIAGQQSSILAYADSLQYIAIFVLLAAPAALLLTPPPRPP